PATAGERLLADSLTTGAAVGFEHPCLLSTLLTAQAAGYRPVPSPVDAQGPTVAGLRAALDDGIRAVVATPRAQNPTGAVISQNRADELSALLCDYPYVLILHDDHFLYLSRPTPRALIS